MKKNMLLLVFTIAIFNSFAQNPLDGIWEGKVNVTGMYLRVIFTVKQDENNKITATMDLPDNGVKGIASKDVMVDKDSLVINIKEFQGSYSGQLLNDSTITGNWKQGIATPLTL
jgi:hypothetical protein